MRWTPHIFPFLAVAIKILLSIGLYLCTHCLRVECYWLKIAGLLQFLLLNITIILLTKIIKGVPSIYCKTINIKQPVVVFINCLLHLPGTLHIGERFKGPPLNNFNGPPSWLKERWRGQAIWLLVTFQSRTLLFHCLDFYNYLYTFILKVF